MTTNPASQAAREAAAEVTQADENAAANLWVDLNADDRFPQPRRESAIAAWLQCASRAFARHRLTATTPEAGEAVTLPGESEARLNSTATGDIGNLVERVNDFTTCGCSDEDWPPLRRDIADTILALTTERDALQAENFTLAAGQCVVKNGLIGDEHGHFYCSLTAERDRALAQGAELEGKMRMIVSHTTGGATSDITLSINDICVLASQKVNAAWETALEKGRLEALAQVEGLEKWHLAAENPMPVACHVLAGYFDIDFGEWVFAYVLSPTSHRFTHWCLVEPPTRIALAPDEPPTDDGLWDMAAQGIVPEGDRP